MAVSEQHVMAPHTTAIAVCVKRSELECSVGCISLREAVNTTSSRADTLQRKTATAENQIKDATAECICGNASQVLHSIPSAIEQPVFSVVYASD